jgi:hypothetical protein
MVSTVALCGNEVVERILSKSLELHDSRREWQVVASAINVLPQKEPDLYAAPMLARTKQRAERVFTQYGAAVGIAFEHGVIKVATVVNLVDLNILEMSSEDIQSPAVVAEIKRRDAEAKRLAPSFASISVATVVDTDGVVFECMTIDGENGTRVSFSWTDEQSCISTCEPDLVSIEKRIQNPTPFVSACGDALLEYYRLLEGIPATKN